jgi:hypothetical protein
MFLTRSSSNGWDYTFQPQSRQNSDFPFAFLVPQPEMFAAGGSSQLTIDVVENWLIEAGVSKENVAPDAKAIYQLLSVVASGGNQTRDKDGAIALRPLASYADNTTFQKSSNFDIDAKRHIEDWVNVSWLFATAALLLCGAAIILYRGLIKRPKRALPTTQAEPNKTQPPEVVLPQ